MEGAFSGAAVEWQEHIGVLSGARDQRQLIFYWRKRLNVAAPAQAYVRVGSPSLVEVELESGMKVRCVAADFRAVLDVLCD